MKKILAILLLTGLCAGIFWYYLYLKPSLYQPVLAWGSKGNENGKFQYIEDFALDLDGNLMVTDALKANVQVFTPEGRNVR